MATRYDHPQQAIEELCRLQAEVAGTVFTYKTPADCFCGTRQQLVDSGSWRNSGKVIEYIKEAVAEKMERER